MSTITTIPSAPAGKLQIQTVAIPANTNASGDIFAGWLVRQMDLAGFVTSTAIAKGRVVTVAIDSLQFLTPVPVGAVVSCYSRVIEVRHSSLQISVEVWINPPNSKQNIKATSGLLTFVAIDEQGRTRAVKQPAG